MSLTQSVTIPLEGEQAVVFQEIEAEEKRLAARRDAMVAIILAGYGLLAAANQTPGVNVNVAAGEIVVTVPQRVPSDGPALVQESA